MKIALCFFGQPRNVENCFEGFENNILKDHSVDVYSHMWNSDETVVNQFLNLYKPKNFLVEDQVQFDMSQFTGAYGLELKFESFAYEKCFTSVSQCYSYKKSNDLILDRDSYDMVIKARTDTGFYRFAIESEQIKNNKYVVPSDPHGYIYNDVIAMCSPNVSNIVASRYDKLKPWYDSGVLDFIPESLTLRALQESNIEIYKSDSLHCDLIR
jgi:hypothetical protein